MKTLSELLAQASNTNVTRVGGTTSGGSRMSLTIVNSRGNGKRLSFSKALVNELQLKDRVELKPAGCDTLLVSKNLGVQNPFVGKLSSDTGKVNCYSAGIVLSLSEHYGLDYTDRTSRSFREIRIETDEQSGVRVAIVTMKASDQEEPAEEEPVNL